MSPQARVGRVVVLCASLMLVLAGCGGVRDVHAIAPEERGLKELGQVYSDFAMKKKRGPKNLQELNIKGQQFPIAVEMIRSGNLMVQWGAPISTEGESGNAILAYIKTVPEQGGKVLFQDGKTIKEMSPEEFNAASKASGR